MAVPVSSSHPDDGILVAYLDRELDEYEKAAVEKRLAADDALRARLEHLRGSNLPYADAFDLLLPAAPQDKLDAILAEATKAAGPQHKAPERIRRRASWQPRAIAAALAIFVLGAAAGYLVPLLTGAVAPVEVAEAPNWRQAVAEYLSFMTPETLSVIPDSPAVLADALTAVGKKISLDLTTDKLALPHVYLKQAQLFEFRGRPLAQLAYLSRTDGALALCIIANGRPDAPLAYEQREGFNIVFWTRDGRGYMLIGKAPRDTLETYAGDLATQVT